VRDKRTKIRGGNVYRERRDLTVVSDALCPSNVTLVYSFFFDNRSYFGWWAPSFDRLPAFPINFGGQFYTVLFISSSMQQAYPICSHETFETFTFFLERVKIYQIGVGTDEKIL